MILENDLLRIVVQPRLGGKITSFYHKEKTFELAAQPSVPMAVLPAPNGNFAPYAFGMDDAFPNIDAGILEWKGRLISYPDHGEIWMAEFETAEQGPDFISLLWRSPMGYRYEKTLTLIGNALHIHYHITNEGMEELPCFWTWHGLMRYERDMELILPPGTTHCRNVLTGPVLGEAGRIYPVEKGSYDFTKVPGSGMSKFYGEHPVQEGRCGLHYPSRNVTCMMEYNAEVLPYFGFWVTAGGFQGDYNCALEPTNGFFDSIACALENGKLPVLLSGETMTFTIKILLE